MIVGLYDIDLFHSSKFYPNLELMKVFNYLNKNNHKVIMMKPKEDEGRFNKIIYFKDSKTKIPKDLIISGGKKDYYGYGFYQKAYPLSPEIAVVPPSYVPYDPYAYKIKNQDFYSQLKKSSYIRFETKDFSDYSEQKKHIYVADHDFLNIEGAASYVKEHSNHQFHFIHGLIGNSEEIVEEIIKYNYLFKEPIKINFNYNEDFFYKNYKNNLIFTEKRDNEDDVNFIERILKIYLWYKKNDTVEHYRLYDITIPETIKNWFYKDKNNKSFIDYYSNDNKIIKEVNKAPTEIRLLLKTNPKKITKENLKLYKNL